MAEAPLVEDREIREYFTLFGCGVPSGLSSRAATSAGTS